MKYPLVSIIVPVYNVEKYLAQALDSIVHQTYSNWEAICVDDGSPDNCGAILDTYAQRDARFKIIHQKNGGVSAARNMGLKALSSKSEYVTFLDPDDLLNPTLLEFCVNRIEKFNLDIMAFGFKYVPDSFSTLDIVGQDKDKLIENYIYGEKDCFYYVWSRHEFLSTGVWGKIWRRNVLNDVTFIEGIKTGEDSMFNWMASYNYQRLLQINFEGYYYRANPGSILHSKHRLAAAQGWNMRMKIISQFLWKKHGRFYRLLPLFGFVKHIVFVLESKLKLRKSARFDTLSFSKDEKTWSFFRVIGNVILFYLIKTFSIMLLMFFKLFRVK